MLPVVEAADVLLVEEAGQLAPAAELAVLDQQLFDEPSDPAVGVVRSGIRDEEVKLIGIAWHDEELSQMVSSYTSAAKPGLRWGVSTEAGLDHCTMRICFEELRRSQDIVLEPNFLILLGSVRNQDQQTLVTSVTQEFGNAGHE